MLRRERTDSMEYIYWLVLFVIFVLLEIITLGLTTIWFAGGALAALLSSLLGADLIVQVILFIVVSLILLIFTRPYAKKYINKNTTKTNIEDITGKTAKVTETIDNENAEGTVLFNGLEWTARAADDTIIPKNSIVTIVKVEGVKLFVERKGEEG